MKSRRSRLTSDLCAVPRGGEGALTAAHLRLQEGQYQCGKAAGTRRWEKGREKKKKRENPVSREEAREDSEQMFVML